MQLDSIGSSHETVLRTRVEGSSPPDISQIAQPTAVLAYAKDGKIKDVAEFMDKAKLNAEFPTTIALTTEGDKIWSIPTKADVKSMIWYPVKAFAAKGYAVPKTWDELVALADKIKTDNPSSFPFCVSAGGPGTATGWELTDWIEEVLLKTEDPQVTATGSATRSRSPTRRSRRPSTRLARSSSRTGTLMAVARRSSTTTQDRHGSDVRR